MNKYSFPSKEKLIWIIVIENAIYFALGIVLFAVGAFSHIIWHSCVGGFMIGFSGSFGWNAYKDMNQTRLMQKSNREK